MTPYILAALTLWVVQTLLPAAIRYGGSDLTQAQQLQTALGGRDRQPDLGLYGGRAQRALMNYGEAIPVFMSLALLLEIQGTPSSLATYGAIGWLACRTLYVPAYLTAIPGIRSTLWTASWGGLIAMGMAVLG